MKANCGSVYGRNHVGSHAVPLVQNQLVGGYILHFLSFIRRLFG